MDDIREFNSHEDDMILIVKIKGELEYFDVRSNTFFKIPAPNYFFGIIKEQEKIRGGISSFKSFIITFSNLHFKNQF